MNKACHVGFLFKTLSRLPLQRSCGARFSSSSSSSSSSAGYAGFSNSSSTDKDEEHGSSVYRRALRTQRPTTLEYDDGLENSISIIGHVDRPLQIYNTNTGTFGVYTLLRARNPGDSRSRHFRVLVEMWNDLAQMCIEHVKPDDFVYVGGSLGCFLNADVNGTLRSCSKITGRKLNYVEKSRAEEYLTPEKSKPLVRQNYDRSLSDGDTGEITLEGYRRHLYRWQLFFTSPHEWWDNRNGKKNAQQPDFKHKDTGEVLWLNPDDPPWVLRQLQLLDSRMAEQSLGEDLNPRSRRVSQWVYDG